jgi:hypothetical protein
VPAWLVAGPPRRIAGQVLRGDRGVAATVRVRLDVPDPRVWRGVDLPTDAEGRFEVWLPAARYQVVVLGVLASGIVAADTRDHEQARLAVLVEPCTPRAVQLVSDRMWQPPIAGGTVEIAGNVVGTTDDHGELQWCGSPALPSVVMRAPGHVAVERSTYDLGAHQVVPRLFDRVRMPRVAPDTDPPPWRALWPRQPSIRGRVSIGGVPVAGAVVSRGQYHMCLAFISEDVLTDLDGTFELRGRMWSEWISVTTPTGAWHSYAIATHDVPDGGMWLDLELGRSGWPQVMSARSPSSRRN